MQLVQKLTIITIVSSILFICLFDYTYTKYDLQFKQEANCIDLRPGHQSMICSNCFKLQLADDQHNQALLIQNDNPFIIMQLSSSVESILSCKQWAQSIISQPQNELQFQPSIQSMLIKLNNSVSISKSVKCQSYDAKVFIQNFSTYVIVYWTKVNQQNRINVVYTNQNNYLLAYDVLWMVIAAGLIAILVKHLSSYQNFTDQNLLTIIALSITTIWNILGDPQASPLGYSILIKLFFFTLVYQKVFESGRYQFFSIFLIIYLVILIFNSRNILFMLEILLSISLFLRFSSDYKRQQFSQQKTSNKKTYLIIVTGLVVLFMITQKLTQQTVFGIVSFFTIQYLCILSLIISTKQMQNIYKNMSRSKQTSPRDDQSNTIQKFSQCEMPWIEQEQQKYKKQTQ